MCQAFDREGRQVAEAFGDTKERVFKKLQALAPTAAEMRIKTTQNSADMREDIGDAPPGMNASCRELAKTTLSRIVQIRRDKLAQAEALLNIAEHAESGSALGGALWGTGRNRRP